MTTYLDKNIGLNKAVYPPQQRPAAAPGDNYQYYDWMSVRAADGLFNDKLEVMAPDGLKVNGKVLNPALAQGFVNLFVTFNSPKVFSLPAPGDRVSINLTGSDTSSLFTNYNAAELAAGAPALDGEGVVYGQLGKAYIVDVILNVVSQAGAAPANPRLRVNFEVDQAVPPAYVADCDVWTDMGPSGTDHSLYGSFLVKSWPAPGTNVGRIVITNRDGTPGSFSLRSCNIRARLVAGAEV